MKLFKRKKPADTPDAVNAADTQPESGAIPAPGVETGTTPDVATDRRFFDRLRNGLGRTSDNLVQGMGNLFLGRKEIDVELLEELELQLLQADVGVEATVAIIDHLTQRVSRRELTSPEGLQNALKGELLALLEPC